MDRTEQEGRDAFVQTLPRKVTELRATLGTLVADPKSQRMRDELRRRLNALYTLTRSFELPTLTDGLREGIAHLDAVRGASVLTSRDLEALADLIATLPALAQRDLPDQPNLFQRRPSSAGFPRVETPAEPTSGAPPAPAKTLPSIPSIPSIASQGSAAPPNAAAPSSRPRSLVPLPKGVAAPLGSTTFGSAASAPVQITTAPPAPVGVLVVGGVPLANEVRRVLPPEADIVAVRTLAEAVNAARDTAPDVIVAETAPPADGLGLLAALRGDPLTDFLPVLLLAPAADRVDVDNARAQGATDVLPYPVDPARLETAIARATQNVVVPSIPPPALGEVTLEELTRTLQEEIRRGILGAAGPRGGATKVPLGAGSEVLAATWEAIARVREVVEKKTRGRVRFQLPAAPLGLGGAHVLSIGDDEEGASDDADPADDPLPGRKALVVDDDPGVVWFFAGILREAGMDVVECTDGTQAFREARAARPDVIISDILMPGLDGFGLCRAIRRDVSLRHTPVILISWKEDLLVRMRELGAQAQGFLRKESRGEAILGRVRTVMRPRIRLLRRIETLADDAELRGRAERVGVFTLIETTARAIGDATITVTDSFSVTELEVRGGNLVAVVRTAQDGSLARGEGALLQVLGASSARFSLRRATSAVRPNLQGDLAKLLAGGAALIAALEDALSGAALLEVASIDLDAEGALSYARSLPEPMRALVERVTRGESPRNLVLRDGVAPQELEPILVELARRGVIRSVRSAEGEDLVAPRYAAALAGESLRPEARPSGLPPSGEMPAIPAAPAVPAGMEVSSADHELAELRALGTPDAPQPERPPSEKPAGVGGAWTPPTTIDEAAQPGFGVEPERDSLADAVLREITDDAARTDDADAAGAEAAGAEAKGAEAKGADAAVAEAKTPPASEAAGDAKAASGAGEAASAKGAGASAGGGDDDDAVVMSEGESEEDLSPEELEKAAKAAGTPLEGVELDARGLPRKRAATTDAPKPEAASGAARGEKDAPADGLVIVDEAAVGAPVEVFDAPKKRPDERARDEHGTSGGGAVAVFFAVIALAALSYFGVRYYLRVTEPGPAAGVLGADAARARDVADAQLALPVAADDGSSTQQVAASEDGGATAQGAGDDAAIASSDGGAGVGAGVGASDDGGGGGAAGAAQDAGTVAAVATEDPAPYLDGGTLAPGQGLLVVEGAGELTIDRRRVGAAPRVVPLAAGVHTLTYRRGDVTGIRVVTVESGRAVRASLPPEP